MDYNLATLVASKASDPAGPAGLGLPFGHASICELPYMPYISALRVVHYRIYLRRKGSFLKATCLDVVCQS